MSEIERAAFLANRYVGGGKQDQDAFDSLLRDLAEAPSCLLAEKLRVIAGVKK